MADSVFKQEKIGSFSQKGQSLPCGRPIFQLKDPGSAITHYIGLVLTIFGTPPLLIHGAGKGMTILQLAALSVFLLSMIGLYGASTTYHAINLPGKGNKLLKKLDLQHGHYYNFYTGKHWGNSVNYDLCINSTDTEIKKIVPIVAKMFK